MSNRQGLATLAGRLLPQDRSTRRLWLAALALSIALALLPWLVRLDGHPHADWEQFLGRFHPLAVHLPIGLLVLVPLLELAGRSRPALREAAGFVLALTFASCLLSLALGLLLAHGSGDAGPLLTRHMAGGIVLTIAVLLCLLARSSRAFAALPYVYIASLTGAMVALLWTAHMGGSITHGNNYLTQYMPASLKRLTRIGTQAPTTSSFYARHINPILDSNCVTCHGEGQAKGGLRMDSYDALMKGGQDGPVISPSSPDKSLLLLRVTLPTGHKQFMPADGKPPLHAEQIAWIRAWVEQGASPTAATVRGVSIREEQAELPLQPVGNYSALMPEIRQMNQGQGAKLMQLSAKPEDGLVLFTVNIAANFGDAQLTQFQKFAPFIVDAELGRTAITDSSFDTLKQFTHLRALHMEGTSITGSGLAKLAPLSQLTYVNLSGTRVTAAAIAALGSMKNLTHIYLYNTPAQPIANTQSQPAAKSAS